MNISYLVSHLILLVLFAGFLLFGIHGKKVGRWIATIFFGFSSFYFLLITLFNIQDGHAEAIFTMTVCLISITLTISFLLDKLKLRKINKGDGI